MFTKNLYLAGRTFARSAPIAKSLQSSYKFPVNSGSAYTIGKPQSLVLSRNFASENKENAGKDHLKEGLPEQYQWTADHLEKYLRNFAAKYNYKQSDVDHLIKTFVTGPSSAKDFFNLDRDSLAAKIGKESPDRTEMANKLVSEVWKETQAVGKQMQNYGSILVGVAAVILGVWGYNQFSGSSDSKDSKKDTKGSAPAKMSEEKKAAENRAADSKDHDKSGSSVSKDSKSSSTPSNKDKKETAQAFKEDGAVGKEFTEKGSIGGAAQKVGGPFDKEGVVGKQFTKDGAIGGAVQKKAEEKEKEYDSKDKKEKKNKGDNEEKKEKKDKK